LNTLVYKVSLKVQFTFLGWVATRGRVTFEFPALTKMRYTNKNKRLPPVIQYIAIPHTVLLSVPLANP
jgi:hypothetical protein